MNKNTIWLVFLSMVISNAVFAQDMIKENITNEYLTQGRWNENWASSGLIEFSLHENETLQYIKFDVNPESNDKIKQQNGIVSIIADSIIFSNWDGAERTAKIIIPENSLNYREKLVFEDNNQSFNNWNTIIRKGDQILWEGTPLIMIDNYGITNDNVRVRVGPGTNHTPYDMSEIAFLEGSVNKSVYFKNQQLFVVGRTMEPEQIGEWNNYWFLVTIPEHSMGGGPEKWVFGEFVDIPKTQHKLLSDEKRGKYLFVENLDNNLTGVLSMSAVIDSNYNEDDIIIIISEIGKNRIYGIDNVKVEYKFDGGSVSVVDCLLEDEGRSIRFSYDDSKSMLWEIMVSDLFEINVLDSLNNEIDYSFNIIELRKLLGQNLMF